MSRNRRLGARPAGSIPKLEDQVIGFRPQDARIDLVQRWTGFSAAREVWCVVAYTSTTPVASILKRPDTKPRVAKLFRMSEEKIRAFTVLTEEQARDQIEAWNQPRNVFCACVCPTPLPLGGMFCLDCGCPGTHTIATAEHAAAKCSRLAVVSTSSPDGSSR
jgi:hypothetical protein